MIITNLPSNRGQLRGPQNIQTRPTVFSKHHMKVERKLKLSVSIFGTGRVFKAILGI